MTIHTLLLAALDVVAVYYPHWHQYPKGDEWFGPSWKEGEWEFVKTGKPRFPGHKVPQGPLVGYLNGKDPADVETEIALASNAGIDVFLYDYYYYGGEITEEEALEQGFLCAKNRARMKFALMWCYHERNFGWRVPIFSERKRLMSLKRTPEEFLGLIDLSIARYFGRPEYWRRDGKLFFSIYNAVDFVRSVGPEAAKKALAAARGKVRAAGLGEVEFNGQNGTVKDSELLKEVGFDSQTDYNANPIPNRPARYAAGERLYDYGETTEELAKRYREFSQGALPYYPSVSTGWDVTLRCQNEEPFPWKGTRSNYPYTMTLTNSTPEIFERNLRQAKDFAENDPKHPGVVYINAWNEVTEGCYLLPTARDSDQMLRCVGRVFGRDPSDTFVFGQQKDEGSGAKNGRAMSVAMPTHENVKYGPDIRQGLDVWLPKDARGPTPIVLLVHGDGWAAGDRMNAEIIPQLAACRARGEAFATVSCRILPEGCGSSVQACCEDAAAAVRCVQAHAAEWNVDPRRITLAGRRADSRR